MSIIFIFLLSLVVLLMKLASHMRLFLIPLMLLLALLSKHLVSVLASDYTVTNILEIFGNFGVVAEVILSQEDKLLILHKLELDYLTTLKSGGYTIPSEGLTELSTIKDLLLNKVFNSKFELEAAF